MSNTSERALLTIGMPVLDKKHHDHGSSPERITIDAGGCMLNVASLINRLSIKPNVRTIACIGDDEYGRLYKSLSPELPDLQVDPNFTTGYVESNFYNGKEITFKTSNGAAEHFRIQPKDVDIGPKIVAIDGFTLALQERTTDLKVAFDSINRDTDLVALSLAGVIWYQGNFMERLGELGIIPNLVFGNEKEYQLLGNWMNIFPHALLKVMTRGKEGVSVLIQNEQVKQLSVECIENEKFVNEFGAGDSLMACMLYGLRALNESKWTSTEVMYWAQVGSFAASMVIQNEGSRLLPNQIELLKGRMASLEKVRRFFR